VFPHIEDGDLLAVEDEAAGAPVTLRDVDPRLIGTTDDDRAGFTEFDLLSGSAVKIAVVRWDLPRVLPA
jgi:hypothetical protein